MEEQVCYTCRVKKKITSFYKKKQRSNGYDRNCKICTSIYNKNWKKNQMVGEEVFCNFKGIVKADWGKLYKFFDKMGYDIHGDLHEQFCLRHNLPYKERPLTNIVRFLPTDF